MTRPRPYLATMLAICLCVVWTATSMHVFLRFLREMYRAGETVGITPSGPGARLSGQLLGFNWHEPPTWYDMTARVLAVSGAMAPVLLPAMWIRRRLASGRRWVPSASGWAHFRGLVALLGGAAVFATLDRVAAEWVRGLLVDLCMRRGGAARYFGKLVVGQNGPFTGGATIDAVGNHLYNYGPHEAFMLLAFATGLLLHWLLWRGDVRAAGTGGFCANCAYDLRATSSAAPCPECGYSQPG